MTLLLSAVAVLLLTGAVAICVGSLGHWSDRLGRGGAVAASVLGLTAAISTLIKSSVSSVRWPWAVPLGALRLELDPLSAFFLIPLFICAACAAIYSPAYLRAHDSKRRLGAYWFFYQLLTAAMVLVLLARNTVFFLVAWETMAVASFFLVMHEGRKPGVVDAGWSYLLASQVGTAALIAAFLLLSDRFGGFDFSGLSEAPAKVAGLAFLLMLIGFGTKAGIVPFHVWLPEAHPAAPSPVSALMSGVMIKMGIYGLMRTALLLTNLPSWCGYLLTALGIMSGLIGVIFALAQSGMKKLLAYSSVENIGIIIAGLGLGLVGLSTHNPPVAVFGFAGALLHVLNHGLFKSLLFLDAGSILAQARTDDLDHLGGLLRRMPKTGAAFLIGSFSISGLPPGNGFISELLIFLAAFQAILSPDRISALIGLGAAAGLAAIGGLALVAFTKAFGLAFLGNLREPRGTISEAGPAMTGPMIVLAVLCLALGLGGAWMMIPLAIVLRSFSALEKLSAATALSGVPLLKITVAFAALAILFGLLLLLRKILFRGERRTAPVWGCGYAAPSSRMQTTGSSFVGALISFFSGILKTRRESLAPRGFFPTEAAFSSRTPDVIVDRLIQAPARFLWGRISGLRRIQSGKMHLYILYIAVTLIVLLIWKLG